jgi:hypothetical protein
MKKIILLAAVLGFMACNTDKKEELEGAVEVAENFINNPESLLEVVDPIKSFVSDAMESADKTMELGKENVDEFLAQAKEYKKCVIITADHTIVLIEDLADCRQSGSWGACMPKAKGYIKKGELQFKEDYINNIIGTPDGQERTVYFFD